MHNRNRNADVLAPDFHFKGIHEGSLVKSDELLMPWQVERWNEQREEGTFPGRY